MQTGNAVRVFDDKPATREATPLLLGLIGPSGGGKTYSALRLATGIQRIVGGEIWGIDTESRRMLHYADRFKFRHVQFPAPFGSLDYLAAIEHCVRKGAKTIIVDSMSHEHEGPGGVLEQHANETKRLAALWKTSEEKAQMSAWSGPKQNRRRMINSILQINANIIFCFRAKEKMKLGGAKPMELGFMPIAGEEFVYEMVLKCLLLPGANGTPTWKSNYPGEQMMMKLPEQFKDMFGEPKQLDEDMGEKLARWAAGSADAGVSAPSVADYESCTSDVALKALEERRAAAWKSISTQQKPVLKAASEAAAKRIAAAAETPVVSTASQRDTSSPIPDDEAVSMLRGAKNGLDLEQVWAALIANYQETNREMPNEVDFEHTTRKEYFDLNN
jgi:ABC-type dipeptide/oligopeptide/nickel transport system ATPase subunit